MRKILQSSHYTIQFIFKLKKKLKEIRVKINKLKFNKNFNFMKTHINIMLTKIQFWFFL